MAEKNSRATSSGRTATTLMAYAQLEIDNSPTCIPRLCKFSIIRVVLNRAIDVGDSNAVVVAVKIQNNKRTFRCCEISLQQDGTLDAPVNLQYLITYPHYFKRDINTVIIYIQRRKSRPMIGYKTLARGEINLNEVIQRPQSLDLHLYLNTNEKAKQSIRSPIHDDNLVGTLDDIQKRPIGYVSIVSLSSTVPTETTEKITAVARGTGASTTARMATLRPKFTLSTKRNHHRVGDLDKSLNDEDGYVEEEELNSELEDSDLEFTSKSKQQKFNANVLRNKIIKMFKRKAHQSTSNPSSSTNQTTTNVTNLSHQDSRLTFDRQSDFEEDQVSDVSDSTIPVDQWSIESVPKPGFTPIEQLQVLKFSEDDPHTTRKSTNPFDSNDSPLDSETSDIGTDIERANIQSPIAASILEEKPSRLPTTSTRDNAVKQLDEIYINDRLPETVICLYIGLNQPHINAMKFKEYNLSVISLSTLVDAKAILNNLIQRIQKNTSQSKQISIIRIVLLGNDAFVNSFLQSYVECLASRPHEYMNYFRFYFVPLVFSYLAKFLGSLDSQYGSLFGNIESSGEFIDIRDLSQKITRYLKTSQRTLSLPIGEVMLNRKGQLPEEDSSAIFLPFFCYVRLGTLSSTTNDSQTSSVDDNILLSKSLSLSLSANPQRESKDSSDEDASATTLPSSSQLKITSNVIKSSHGDESNSLLDISVDYWTLVGNNNESQKEKKDGIRTIKSSLKSNIRILTITRQATTNFDPKFLSPLTMTYVTREKKQKIMKFGKKIKDFSNTKVIEPQIITKINRLVCTSKSHNVGLKVNVDGQEWSNVNFFQITPQWQTHIKHLPLAIFNEIRSI